MSMREGEGLVRRIRQIRRSAAAAEKPAASASSNSDAALLRSLEARVAHLEQLLEGLQDSVHRESERQGKQIAELQAQVQPEALVAALSKDARERGL
jgi:vacuolar-type H+-ATPase subunit I/STV1